MDKLDINPEKIENHIQQQAVVIGFEGGPCGGKTSLLENVRKTAEQLGKTVLIIPETASIFIESLSSSGKNIADLATRDRPAYLEFQEKIVRTIFDKIETAKTQLSGSNAVIVIDRPDIGAYVTKEEYRRILQSIGRDKSPIHSHIDKLIYLPSVATTNPALYDELRHNNRSRYETSAEEAKSVCARNLEAVRTHPELEIAWGGDFGQTIKRLTDFVLNPHTESEIKQHVGSVDAEAYLDEANERKNLLHTMHIRQSYHQYQDRDFRLRRTACEDGVIHHHLTIKTGGGITRTEHQINIPEETYYELSEHKLIGRAIQKFRHIILDLPDRTNARRMWYADKYHEPFVPDWYFETSVFDETEASKLDMSYPHRHRVVEDTKTLVLGR